MFDDPLDAPADFCPHGCYWECEHRTERSAESRALMPVEHPVTGATLRMCMECGDYFYDAIEHAQEHARLRQLGYIP